MTPTMSEYFEAWKNSRFIAGEDAERARLRRDLAALGHRRHPRGDRSSPTTRSSRRSRPRTRSRPSRPSRQLDELLAFVEDLRDQEADGKKFTGRGGRHARLRGPAPGRGDRRPGDPGRPAARDRAPGGIGDGRGCRRLIARPRRASSRPSSRSPRRASPRAARRPATAAAAWAGGRADPHGALRRPQTDLLLDGGSPSAPRPRPGAALDGPLERGLRRYAPGRAARRCARRSPTADGAVADGDRGRRSPPPTGPPSPRCAAAPTTVTLAARRRGDDRRARPRLAPDPRLPPGDPLHAARASTRPTALDALAAGDLAPADAVDRRSARTSSTPTRRAWSTYLDEAATESERGFDAAPSPSRRRSPPATGRSSRPSTRSSAAPPSARPPTRDVRRARPRPSRRRRRRSAAPSTTRARRCSTASPPRRSRPRSRRGAPSS